MTLAGLLDGFREHPLAATLEFGTLVGCVVLFVGTVALLLRGAPTGRGDPWLIVVGLGAAIVLLWTFVVPLVDRLR